MKSRTAKGALSALLAVVSVGIVAAAVSADPGPGVSAPIASRQAKNPSASLNPSAAFRQYCSEARQATRCNAAALAEIDLGRRAEHLPALKLPKNFASRTTPAQLKTLANLERTARHLPRLARSSALDTRARAGAARGVDPTGPANYAWDSNLSSGLTTALAADFAWMYDDGPGSPNSDCSSAGAAGCWGHRDNILSAWGGQQGTADYVGAHGAVQLTELFVENY